MKKLNYPFMLMATTIIFSLTFSSCVKAIKNSIDDEERQNENLAAEQKKSEITRVSDESLIIYTPSQAIKLNPKFKIAGDQEKIKEAYNKPGTQILFSETDSINYLAKSLWTKYNYSKERVMISYDKSKKQFIFWTNKTEIKEALDILPMLIFLAMLSILIYSLFNKLHIKTFLPAWLLFLIFCLNVNLILKSGTETMLMAITFSLVIIIPYFMVYGISINFFEFIGFKDLPMPKRHAKSAPVVVAYSLVATIAFLFFTKLGFHYFWLFILFLSPYLIFLIIKVAKASRSWVLGKMIRKTE